MLQQTNPDSDRSTEKRVRLRYAILTIALFLPLLTSFLLARNIYPAAAWTVMMSGGSLQRPWTYYIVRGETVSNEIVDIRPPKLTNALSGRTWSLASAAVNNDAFRLENVHPLNLELIHQYGGYQYLPRGQRVPELLRAWGKLYNEQLPASSPARIKAIRIDVYRWGSGAYRNYDRFVETWRQEL